MSRSAVYWAVDRRAQVYWGPRIRGENLAMPESWRLLYDDEGTWKPLGDEASFTLQLDQSSEAEFPSITTRAIRLEVDFAS